MKNAETTPATQAFEQLLQAIPKPTPEERAAQLAASQAAADMRNKTLLSPQVAALKVIAEDRVTAYRENDLFCVTYRSPSHWRARGAHQSMKQYESLMAGPISEPEGIPPGDFEAALAKNKESMKCPHCTDGTMREHRMMLCEICDGSGVTRHQLRANIASDRFATWHNKLDLLISVSEALQWHCENPSAEDPSGLRLKADQRAALGLSSLINAMRDSA